VSASPGVLLGDVATMLRRELLRYRRDRAYWLGQIVFPLVVVGFIGFGLDDVVDLPTGTSYLAHVASGALALLVASGAVGGGFSLIEDRESGFLRALRVAPVSPASLVLGKIAARGLASIALVGCLVGLLAIFTPIGLPHPGAALLAVAAITAAFVALGVALASALQSLESFRVLSALVTIPLYFLSGIFYPVTTLPPLTRFLARSNPLTYGVDLLRYGLLGIHEFPLLLSAFLLLGLTAAAVALAVVVFERGSEG
jgi:ABC-2 type transport system permease protein